MNQGAYRGLGMHPFFSPALRNVIQPNVASGYTGVTYGRVPVVDPSQPGGVGFGSRSYDFGSQALTDVGQITTRNVATTSYSSAPQIELQSTWGGSAVISISGTYTASVEPALQLNGTWNNSSIKNFRVIDFSPTISPGSSSAVVQGIYISPTLNTVSAFTGITIGNGATGTVTTAVGLDIGVTNVLSGTTKWAMKIGNYQSYHQGPLTLGGTGAPTWDLHVQGGNAATNGIGLDVSTTGPTAPASNGSGVISVYKGTTNYYLLVTFNDAGTTRYRYMQLNGTTATWTEGTTLPT